jgi:hypothetical protein
MLLIPNKKFRKRNVPVDKIAAGPAALTLIAANFDPDGPEVYLTFDRAIDVSGLVVGAFVVRDGPNNNRLVGFEGPALITPTEVQVLMTSTGSYSGADVLFTAGAGNGIVATDDGGTWSGCVDLVLPFP